MNLFCSLLAVVLGIVTDLNWTVGYSADRDAAPEKFVEAIVPGACQLDIAKAENYPDYKYSDNYKMFSWMEDVYFTYRTVFDAPSISKDERVWFCSKGIDYEFDILLNGEKIFYQEGMFRPVQLDITDRLHKSGNVMEILIYKAPKHHDSPVNRTQAAYYAKPPVSYEWDWHPRLIPCGIYDETGLQIRKKCHISTQAVKYSLSDDFKKASITVEATVSEPKNASLEWILSDMSGKEVAKCSKALESGDILMETELENPQLWWTHDHGTPYLYNYKLNLKDKSGKTIQTESGRVGFRRIRLVMNEGAWAEPESFPKSRSNPPAQFELNGRRIFAKGSNWLAPDIFLGRITRATYEPLIDLAVGANMNAFRCWGGCAAGKDSFFDLCDEKGILVWQEFPLACNKYPDDTHYLSILELEARAIVTRLHPHPCIALWCGGNELFNSWSKMDDQSLPLRLLNKICYEMAPEIPFNPTSPLGGMAHGCYLFDYCGDNVFNWMNNAHYTAYTEFGMPSIADRKTIESIIPADELFPVKDGGAWRAHHAFGAWGAADTWISETTLTKYFGVAGNLDELIANSQTLQCIGYQFIFEESRRQKPYCAMSMNWCYNEPWPAAANNSLVTFPSIAKPALKAVGDACRPVCASLEMDKFQWPCGEDFICRAWLLNDSFDEYGKAYKLFAGIELDGKSIDLGTWTTDALAANTNAKGPEFSAKLPKTDSKFFKVFVKVDGHPEMDSEYIMSVLK